MSSFSIMLFPEELFVEIKVYWHVMFNIFTSVSLGQCCGSKTHTDKWVWCLEEGALCCITVRNLGHKLHSPLYFPLKAATLRNRWAESISAWLVSLPEFWGF